MNNINTIGLRCKLLIAIVPLLVVGHFNYINAYGEKVVGAEKDQMVKEIRQLVRQIKNTGYTKVELAYFPMLKVRTNTYNDSVLNNKLQTICKLDVSKMSSYDELEDITTFLIEVYDAINDIIKYERLIDSNPPVVSLEELVKYWDFMGQKQSGHEASIDVDTNKLLLFYKYDFFISYANGTKRYENFIQQARMDPFIDMLVDVNLLQGDHADTVHIMMQLMDKIIKADERVRLLAFGYYGIHIAEKVYVTANSRYVKIIRQKKLLTPEDSAYVELFCSTSFKEFGKIYSKYAKKIDQMKISVGYSELLNESFFDDAQHIKEFLKKVAIEKN